MIGDVTHPAAAGAGPDREPGGSGRVLRLAPDAEIMDAIVDDEGRDSFPASDPPSSWSGAAGDPVPARRALG